jgi:hypothetical protein
VERIRCSAPLPENPAGPLLMKMLVPASYHAPAKNNRKKTEDGLHPRSTLSVASGETEDASSEDEDEEEEEGDTPSLQGRKRAASEDLEVEAHKRGKISLSDGSGSEADAVPKHLPRDKPLTES